MKKDDTSETRYCCQLMKKFVEDPRVEIGYSSKFRDYFLGTTSGAIQIIPHCPFCGYKLPKSLREEWFEILEREFNLDDPYCESQQKKIPEEFKSNKWWKKRNL